jgi:hypothetical protein
MATSVSSGQKIRDITVQKKDISLYIAEIKQKINENNVKKRIVIHNRYWSSLV